MHIGHPRAVLFNVFMVRNGITEINSRIRQIIPQMNMHGCLIHFNDKKLLHFELLLLQYELPIKLNVKFIYGLNIAEF